MSTSNDRSGRPVVVAGLDLSTTANVAAQRAAQIAEALHGRLHLVSAVRRAGSETIQALGEDWTVEPAAPTIDYLDRLAAHWSRVPTTTACVTGRPAEVIVSEAERLDASLIVVGNRHMKGVGRVLGAVAADVAHHAPCDVLIVKTVD
jgi:nucleotide-binding universal stress UspA family protein